MNYKVIHIVLTIEQQEPTQIRGELRCPEIVSNFCFTGDTRRVLLLSQLPSSSSVIFLIAISD